MEEERTCKTPLNDLREEALKHYEEAASSIHCYRSDVPRAIEYYYQQRELQEIKAVNTKKLLVGVLLFIALYALCAGVSLLLN